jgi:ribonuclease P protein component
VQKGVNVLLQQLAPNKEIPKRSLRRRSDYLKTYKGFSVRRPLLTLYARSNGLESHRFGFTTPKTTGTAVVRNGFKRWCREFYRKADLSELKKPVDLHVYVGSKKVKKDAYKQVQYKEFFGQLREALQLVIKNFK